MAANKSVNISAVAKRVKSREVMVRIVAGGFWAVILYHPA